MVRATDRRGRTFLADPDYGTVIPHPVAVIERNPEVVRSYYRMPFVDERTLVLLTGFYGPEGNREWTIPQYFYHKIYYAEHAAYVLKWLLPLLLILPMAFRLRRMRKA